MSRDFRASMGARVAGKRSRPGGVRRAFLRQPRGVLQRQNANGFGTVLWHQQLRQGNGAKPIAGSRRWVGEGLVLR